MSYSGKHRVPTNDRRQQQIDADHSVFDRFCNQRGLDPKSAKAQRAYTEHLRAEAVAK
jgi:hypothetical protein